LAQAGCEVHFLDRRGSGLNLAARGDVPDYRTWLTDVEAYLDALPKDAPKLLLGISWGGKFVPALAAQRPDLIAGAGMICPGLYARQQPNVVQRLALQTANAMRLQSQQIAIPLKDPALFTDSPAWQDYIARDPLTLRRVTVRFALEDRRLTLLARDAAERIHVPVLLMLAGRERIVDNERTRAFFERMASANKSLIEYPDAGHTFEFDRCAPDYLRDLRDWSLRIAGARDGEL
jgi:alpha-beta hydrolase superfamily lysophospholipase